MDYLEIAPGICVIEDTLCFCPGCGMEVVGGDHLDPADVLSWFLAVYQVVTIQGAEGYTPEKAKRDAEAYIRKPWHMEAGEKGETHHA